MSDHSEKVDEEKERGREGGKEGAMDGSCSRLRRQASSGLATHEAEGVICSQRTKGLGNGETSSFQACFEHALDHQE